MKKFATLIATSALAFAGLVVAPGASVAAEPYPQTVATKCSVRTNTPVRKGRAIRARVRWTSAGNAQPAGKVRVRLVRKRDGKVIRSRIRTFSGNPMVFKFKRVRVGRYAVKVRTITASTSVFKGCSARAGVRVVRR